MTSRFVQIIKKILKGDWVMLWENLWYNFFSRKVQHSHTEQVSFVLLHKGSSVQIDGGELRINARLDVGKRPTKAVSGTKIWIQKNGVIDVRGNFIIHDGASVHIHPNGKLIVHGGFINNYARIVCEGIIEIGEDVAIAPGVIIRSCDSHHIVGQESVKDIHIGNHVWIGENAIILKGVNIGEGAVIGAGAVVTKDVPAHCVAVGNPAHVKKENINWTLDFSPSTHD